MRDVQQQQARLEEAFERIEETILPCIAMMLDTLLDASAKLAEIDPKVLAAELQTLAAELEELTRAVERSRRPMSSPANIASPERPSNCDESARGAPDRHSRLTAAPPSPARSPTLPASSAASATAPPGSTIRPCSRQAQRTAARDLVFADGQALARRAPAGSRR